MPTDIQTSDIPGGGPSRRSVKARELVENLFNNPIGHLAPFRFILDIREEIPSPELFREFLYMANQNSYKMFLQQDAHRHYVPNPSVLYEIVSENPQDLITPIVLLITKGESPELLMGPGAGIALQSMMEKRRKRQIGPTVKILDSLARGRQLPRPKKRPRPQK